MCEILAPERTTTTTVKPGLCLIKYSLDRRMTDKKHNVSSVFSKILLGFLEFVYSVFTLPVY